MTEIAPSSRWRRWLRLGPSRADLLRAEVATLERRLHRSNYDRDQARAQTRAVQAQLDKVRAEIHDALNEPARVDGCSKIRFHREPEAEDFMVDLAGATGESIDDYNVYDCKVCPRSPVTHRRYWHVGHLTTDAREQSIRRRNQAAAAARRNGNTIGQRIDPRVLAQLRQMSNRGEQP